MKKYTYLLAFLVLLCTQKIQAQTLKALSYDISNNTIAVATNTNPITFRNPIAWATNSHRDITRTNLSLGAAWLTNTNVTNFRTAIELGATNDVQFESVTVQDFISTLSIKDTASGFVKINLDNASLNYNATNAILEWSATEVQLNKPLTFFGTNTAAVTRTNLGLVLPALTNANVTSFRTAIGLGATNDVTHRSMTATSVIGVENGGDEVYLTSASLSSPTFGENWSFEENRIYEGNGQLFEYSDSHIRFTVPLFFGENVTRDETLANLALADVVPFWGGVNSASSYIASSFTGLGRTLASYGEVVTLVTNFSGRGLPVYRLDVPLSSPRTNSDLAAIRSSFRADSPYFSGPIRTKLNWSNTIQASIQVASVNAGGGSFQFTFGEGPTPTFATNVNSLLPIPAETFIGFRLTRAGTPAYWVPSLIFRSAPGEAVITNTGSNMATSLLGPVSRFLLSVKHTASNSIVRLELVDSVTKNKTTLVVNTNSPRFVLSTTTHLVNWMAGVCPTPPVGTNTIGQITYDVEPPTFYLP